MRKKPPVARRNAVDSRTARPALVTHTIEPVYDERSRVLVLGTMPSPKSREVGFFYGHPQNRFWRVMEALFGLEDRALADNDARRAFLLNEHIALWDVLASCEIDGASDASIRNARPNDLRRILDAAPITAVFTTGTKAAHLYRRYCEDDCGMPATPLPSTSPANARMRLPELVEAYRPLLDALRRPKPPKPR